MAGYPAFLCDGMLGSLARWLRLLGFDAAYAESSLADPEILDRAVGEGRTLLTRDADLLRRSRGLGHPCREPPHGSVLAQVQSLIRDGTLRPDPARFFTRCTRCNGALKPQTKADVEGRVPPAVLERHREFWGCESCEHLYWRGTHVAEIHRKLLTLEE